jgi:DNA-binding CsgD family transcriptional regulator
VVSFEEFVEQSEAATTACQLETHFKKVMVDEGFENQFMGRIVGRSVAETQFVHFPEGHFETYLAERWDEVDPIMAFTATATRPFCWDDVASRMQFNREQTALLDECRRVGVHSIVVVPFPNPNGGCDIIGVSRRHADRPDRAHIAVLQAICAQTWCRHADLVAAGSDNEWHQITLTSRELEILKWMKDGKSNSEISQIIGLSVKTIEYHVGNVLKKLAAPNRTTAVVIAIKLRLLAL